MKGARVLAASVIVVLLVGTVIGLFYVQPAEKGNLRIGAILPMSGPAAVWGESIRNGMELVKDEINKSGISVDVFYEDSKASAAEGISAYNKLKEVDKVDIVFSAFSRVSVPLIPMADEDKIPIIMTVVSAKGVAERSPFAFRFYSNERQYVDPHFERLGVANYSSIAVLRINDEFGSDVSRRISEKAGESGINIVLEEKFDPGSTDFRTQLIKIKSKNPNAVLVVTAVPAEIINILKQAKEINLDTDIFEASAVLSSDLARRDAGESTENVFTMAFPFTLKKTGEEFRTKYKEKYGSEPSFAAAFGYDMMKLAVGVSGGKSMKGEELASRIIDMKNFDSLNGPVAIQSNGEINPELYSVKIINGSLFLAD